MNARDVRILGVMSGSSLDGLDLAVCRFWMEREDLHYSLEHTDTIAFSDPLVDALGSAYDSSGSAIFRVEQLFTSECAELIQRFISESDLKVDIIGFHGHTVFHEPQDGFTVQIGDGHQLSQKLSIDVIGDFRSKDVALGGQGAPLAPIVEKHLFKDYRLFLNLGGIANISIHNNDQIIAFDITACNQALNYLSQHLGEEYDDKGKLARSGSLKNDLLSQLSQIPYLSDCAPKSLSNTWVKNEFIPMLKKDQGSINDQLNTVVEHIAIETANAIPDHSTQGELLVTGGGAHNDYLIERMDYHLRPKGVKCARPSEKLINYKEAILMSLMAYLRIMEQPNCLASVTGASRDSSTGIIYKAAI